MAIFNFWKTNKNVIPQKDKLLNPRSIINLIGNDNISVFGETTKQKNLQYFVSVPEVFQVITTKSRMFAKMNLTVKSKVTGKQVDNNNRIQRLIRTPNWYQTTKEFLTQDKIFREIYGNNFIYFDYPLGFSKKSTKQLFTLNPYYLNIYEPTGGLPPFMRSGVKDGTKYQYQYEGKVFDIQMSDVLHLNNNNVKDDKLIGMSQISALKPNIENIISAYESRGIILRNRGALGILSNSAKDQTGAILPFDSKEIKQIQDKYSNYGLSKEQWQIIITNLTLKWQPMIMKPSDLMLFEEIEEDFRKICDAYGFKAEIFSTKSGSTFENAKQYEKSAYQNTIIPEAQEYINGLNDFFETESESYIIVGEFQDLHIFDEDKKYKADTIQLTTNSLSKAYTDGAIDLAAYQRELAKWGIGNNPN